jgi:hypothetical protein
MFFFQKCKTFSTQAVNLHCFPAFLSIPPQQFKLVLDSIIWAFKHTMRNVADIGLNILIQLLQVRRERKAFFVFRSIWK